MPTIVNTEDSVVTRQGEGWTEITVANEEIIGSPAMVARLWLLEPGTQGPEMVQGEVDQLLYVIRGSGKAIVNGKEMVLTDESVLWLDPGEHYQFIAGEDTLEILQGYAPGG